MTSQTKWFAFGAVVGLPVALFAFQLHWVAVFNVAVALVKSQLVLPQHGDRSELAEVVVTIHP